MNARRTKKKCALEFSPSPDVSKIRLRMYRRRMFLRISSLVSTMERENLTIRVSKPFASRRNEMCAIPSRRPCPTCNMLCVYSCRDQKRSCQTHKICIVKGSYYAALPSSLCTHASCWQYIQTSRKGYFLHCAQTLSPSKRYEKLSSLARSPLQYCNENHHSNGMIYFLEYVVPHVVCTIR